MDDHSQFVIRQRELVPICESSFRKLKSKKDAYFKLNEASNHLLEAIAMYQNRMEEFSLAMANVQLLTPETPESLDFIELCSNSLKSNSRYMSNMKETVKDMCDPLSCFDDFEMNIQNQYEEYVNSRSQYSLCMEREQKGKTRDTKMGDAKTHLQISSKCFMIQAKNVETNYTDGLTEKIRNFTISQSDYNKHCYDAFEDFINHDSFNTDFSKKICSDYNVNIPETQGSDDIDLGIVNAFFGGKWKIHYSKIIDGCFKIYLPWDNKPEESFDLELCNVKPDSDEPLAISLISALKPKIIIKTFSRENYDRLLTELQLGISFALTKNLQGESSAANRDAIEAIWNLHPSNKFCADCGQEDPEWVVINTGSKICIKCSGVHRSLGTHISKVRSLGMDTFNDETTEIIEQMNNEIVNQIFQPRPVNPINANSSREARNDYITAKYKDRSFIIRFSEVINLDLLALESIKNSDIIGLIGAQCQGANMDYKTDKGKTLLHVAIVVGELVLGLLLLLNGANPNSVDDDGRTPLHHAFLRGKIAFVKLLCEYGADVDAKDNYGNDLNALAAAIMESKEIKNYEEMKLIMEKYKRAVIDEDNDEANITNKSNPNPGTKKKKRRIIEKSYKNIYRRRFITFRPQRK